jgi:hypothetical protein
MATNETRRQEYTRTYGEIVGRARLDPEFQQRLVANPAAVLRERGIEVPASTELKVIDFAENVEPIKRGGNIRYLVLPPGPINGARSGKQLPQIGDGADTLIEDWVSLLLDEADDGAGELADEDLAQVAAADGWLEMGEIREVRPSGGGWLKMGDIIIVKMN